MRTGDRGSSTGEIAGTDGLAGAVGASSPSPSPRVSPPGLLAWEVYFLAYAAGVWSLRHFEPAVWTAALLGLGLAAFRWPDALRPTRRGADALGGLTRALAAVCLCALCFAGGRWHASVMLPPTPDLPQLVAQSPSRALVRARVAEVTDKPFGRLEILLEDASATFTPKPPKSDDADNATPAPPQTVAVPGLVSWDWDAPGYRPAPGQNVTVELRLRPVHGFADFGGSDFEWRERLRGVFVRTYARGADIGASFGPRPRALCWDLREGLRQRLIDLLPRTQGGAIVLGLLIGDRSLIDRATTDELRMAGLSHTLALSGLNVVYVAVLGLALAWIVGLLWPGVYLRIPRPKLAVLLAFPLVAAYVWVGQASPSLVRSAWMFGFWGLLLLLDRGRALIDGLFLALVLICALDPLSVYDVGLQMSAVAVAGMALPYAWASALVPRPAGFWGRALHWAWDAFVLALCANLSLLPVTVWYFGTYPPDFLLNLPWLPVQGLVVQVLGMVGMALAPLPHLSGIAGALLAAAAHAQDWMLAVLGRLAAGGWFPTWALLRPLWPELLGAGMVLSAAPFCWPRPRVRALGLLTVGLLLAAWPQARLLADQARDEVRLDVIDVGQAQALLVTAPGGRRALIDAGGSFSPTFDMGRSVVGPALTWNRPPRLDAACFSHPDSDHAQGLAWILRQFDVGRFYTNGRWPEGRLDGELTASLREGVNAGRLAPTPLVAGERIDLGSGVELLVEHPAAGYEGRGSNGDSLVLRLVWRGHGLAVLPGDVDRDGIEDMIDHGRSLGAQVLVLPHHGSKSALSGMLYEAVAPRLAVASCGFQNMYHFPNKDVAAELASRGIPLVATPERGMIEFVWTAPEAGFSLRSARP